MYLINRTYFFMIVLWCVIFGSSAAQGSSIKVYHGFEIKVGKDMPDVRNVRFRYGDLGWIDRPIMGYPGSSTLIRSQMIVPDIFEISWSSLEGKKYEYKIPISSKVPSDMEKKKILIIIMQDKVEGYIETPLPNYQYNRTRFY